LIFFINFIHNNNNSEFGFKKYFAANREKKKTFCKYFMFDTSLLFGCSIIMFWRFCFVSNWA